jgi:hypothetical protein
MQGSDAQVFDFTSASERDRSLHFHDRQTLGRESATAEVRIQDALGCRNISRVGHYGPPGG